MRGFIFSMEAILAATLVVLIIGLIGFNYVRIEKESFQNNFNHYSEKQISEYWFTKREASTSTISGEQYCSEIPFYKYLPTGNILTSKKICTVIK